MESIKINGKEIRAGLCSCLTATVEDKTFGLYIKGHFAEKGNCDVSITEDKVIGLINQADSINVVQDSERPNVMLLHIDTKTHHICVDVEKGDE
jgi:hypothetical protein